MKLRVPYWATSGFDVKLNGVSVASNYKPSSYVTIPARNWTTTDVVEIIMPFGKHIDFGPDKMERAVTLQEANAQFAPMWTGVFMYGPLAMTATGISTWEEATIDVDSYLNDVILNGPSGGTTGANSNLYTLTHGGRTFQPDYYRDVDRTLYFRMNIVGDSDTEAKMALYSKIQEARVLRSEGYTEASFSRVNSAITAALNVYQNDNATEAQYSTHVSALNTAIANLVSSGFIHKDELGDFIYEAESMSANRYTWDSFANLQSALTAAKLAYASSTSQAEVDMHRIALSNALRNLAFQSRVNKNALREHVNLARERNAEQEKWNALAVKVPAYPPWAPHGFGRLLEQLVQAEKVLGNTDKNYNQTEVNTMVTDLNAAINTMRPGNLPEPEDLSEVQTLLSNARAVRNPSATLREAIAHAQMVVDYVNDGSGTGDMIENAVERLKAALR